MQTKTKCYLAGILSLVGCAASAADFPSAGSDHHLSTVAEQREHLAQSTRGKGFGPQSPRDIDRKGGSNTDVFSMAPPIAQMNLCNIHFHKNAEHKGEAFGDYAGDGDGLGNESGYRFSGHLTRAELTPLAQPVCAGEHGALVPGDTIEVHYVYSTATVRPGPTLNSCLSESVSNPQLRVDAQVFVLVNDRNAMDFGALTRVGQKGGYFQASDTALQASDMVEYEGSTTGPGYNEKGSPYQVTWQVNPHVTKVDIATVGRWCEKNEFEEHHAHGVRNLIENPALLSPIGTQG
ncbi:delta-class carbonic anhydrase [Nitrogeniibacter aestuarii]|uniref:delta-class carbonic anhydrase n=1 Tax=Nitrogeniibacter aestuarii TaxID=2815343 RepID=UPI001E310D4B|nr:delta-class carbonic anhydrase [Nitrogeniibacter aestuarii]